ncbi:all-trans-retinol 13,14-reductase-like [Symsagittifera roscoffensis]|uniref:all-trans-retinol 13,14-reductase-like n=1 Tax=Symsagittifera roscoffensis TaxID=84072 RepID=UPI00307C9B92
MYSVELRINRLNFEFLNENRPEKIIVQTLYKSPLRKTVLSKFSIVGRKVLVLEQHTKLGGCCHTFKEGRFEFDTGLHYVGNMNGRGFASRALDQLSNGQIQWDPMSSVYDELVLGTGPESFKKFPIYAGFAMWKQSLLETFPTELKAIESFEKLLTQASGADICFGILKMTPRWFSKLFLKLWFLSPVKQFHMYFERSAHDVVSSLTSNIELQACFNYLWGDFGAPPKQAPFFMCMGANEHYIKYGAFYPRNGPAIIPYYLMKTIRESGGQFYTKANVSQILLRKDQKGKLEAYGVEIKSQKGPKVQFTAEKVVSGAGVLNTFQKLIPREITEKSCPDMNRVLNKTKPSASYLNLFIGFKETSAQLKLPACNNWVVHGADFDAVYNEWMGYEDPYEAMEKMSLPFLFVGFPSAKDGNYDYNNNAGSTCVAITLVPYKWFEMWNHLPLGKRGEQYEALKTAFTQKIWEKILQLYPQLEDKREICVLGSSVTSNHYLNTDYGEIYGLEHTLSRFSSDVMSKVKPKTEIKGLYLTGQDVTTCGISSAITAGVMTSTQILGRNLFTDLKKLYNRIGAK